MQRYFSPSVGGFFSEDIHGDRMIESGDPAVEIPNPACTIPADAIAIDENHWRDLIAESCAGRQIVVVDGAVIAIDPPIEGGA